MHLSFVSPELSYFPFRHSQQDRYHIITLCFPFPPFPFPLFSLYLLTRFFLIFHFSPFRLHLPLSHLVYLISPAILHTTTSTYFFPSLCFLIFFSTHSAVLFFPFSSFHLHLSPVSPGFILFGRPSLTSRCLLFSIFSKPLQLCLFSIFFTSPFLCTCPPVSPGLCNFSCHHSPPVEYQIITLCSSFSLFSKHTHSLTLFPPPSLFYTFPSPLFSLSHLYLKSSCPPSPPDEAASTDIYLYHPLAISFYHYPFSLEAIQSPFTRKLTAPHYSSAGKWV